MSMGWFGGVGEAVLLLQGGGIAVETAVENDTALGIVAGSSQAVETGQETDTAFDISSGSSQAVETAQETDTAFNIIPSSSLGIETAIEADTAFDIVSPAIVETAIEIDTAFDIVAGSRQLLDVAEEFDSAFIIPTVVILGYNLYRGTASGFVPSIGNKIASTLVSDFLYVDQPLEEQTAYYYIASAIVVGTGEVYSVEIVVMTLVQLALILAASTSGEFAHAEDVTAVEIQYQTTTNADAGFAAPFSDVIQTGVSRHRYLTSGLSAGLTYRTRARTRPSSGGAFERWSKVIVWIATPDTFGATVNSRFTSPPFAFLMRGPAAVMTWVAAATVIAVDISADLGLTWTPMVGWTQTGIVFNTIAFPDGTYIVRVTQTGTCPYFYHGGFLIDNAVKATYEDDFFTVPRPLIAKYWNPSIIRWLPTVAVLKGSTGHIGASPVASFGPIEPPELTQCRGVIFMGECVAMGTGAGFQWDRTQAGDILEMGLVVLGAGVLPGGEPVGVRVNVEHFFMTSAQNPANIGGLPDPSDPFRFVGVAQANEHNRFEVVIGSLGGIPDSGWHKFSLPCTVAMGWTKMTLGGTSQYISFNKLRPYQFILWVIRPDPVGFPARIRVRARLDGPDAWACNGRRQTLVDQTIDVARPNPLGAIPYTFDLGHIAFYTDKIAGNRSEDSGRFLTRYSVVLIPEPGEIPPIEPPIPPSPDVPQEPTPPGPSEPEPPFGEAEACFLIPFVCTIDPVPGACTPPTATIVAYVCKGPELILVFGEECIPVAISFPG